MIQAASSFGQTSTTNWFQNSHSRQYLTQKWTLSRIWIVFALFGILFASLLTANYFLGHYVSCFDRTLKCQLLKKVQHLNFLGKWLSNNSLLQNITDRVIWMEKSSKLLWHQLTNLLIVNCYRQAWGTKIFFDTYLYLTYFLFVASILGRTSLQTPKRSCLRIRCILCYHFKVWLLINHQKTCLPKLIHTDGKGCWAHITFLGKSAVTGRVSWDRLKSAQAI